METREIENLYQLAVEEHGSYLQGMETQVWRQREVEILCCTDPTYKEWKQILPSSGNKLL